MLDLETLGTKPGCVVLSIGAVAFGPTGVGAEFYTVLSHEDQVATGLVEDPDTVAWWAKQSPAARRVFDEEQTPLREGLQLFTAFCAGVASPGKLLMWGNGSDFDNPILRAVYDAAALNAPWGKYNNRCFRTLKNLPLSCRPMHKPEVPHHALYDAKAQALNAVQYLNELDPTGRW
jgi:hypothetical protein